MSEPSPPVAEACANCGAPLLARYCGECGQRRMSAQDRSMHALLAQFWQGLTDLDGRFWGSLRTLLFRPGRLSRDHIAGRRKRWMSPVGLFLLANVIYFFSAGLTDFDLPFDNQVSGDLALASLPESVRAQRAAQDAYRDWSGQPHSVITSPWVRERIAARQASRPDYSVADYAEAYNRTSSDISRVLIILHVPFLAFALWLLFPGRKLLFADHMVVALHLMAWLLFLINLLIMPMEHLFSWLQWRPGHWVLGMKAASAVLILGYFGATMRAVYRVGWLRALISAIASIAFFFLVGSVFVYRSLQFLLVYAIT